MKITRLFREFFDSEKADIITHSKIAVFIASLVAGLLGFVMLKIILPTAMSV